MMTPTSAVLPALGNALGVSLGPLAALAAGAVLIALVVLIAGLLVEACDGSSFARLAAAGDASESSDPAAPVAERPAA